MSQANQACSVRASLEVCLCTLGIQSIIRDLLQALTALTDGAATSIFMQTI